MTLSSYGKPLNLGHRHLASLWDGGSVVVQEKVDGSQINFGRRGDKIFARSRRQELHLSAETGGMFRPAIKTIMALAPLLVDGWTYRGEFLSKPKHNTLKYGRAPRHNIILFDVDQGDQDMLAPIDLQAVADILGLECVPHLATFVELPPPDVLAKLLEYNSILSTPDYVVKIEGVVFKNYSRRDEQTSKIMMGKLVSEDFREAHSTSWKIRNPGRKDIIQTIIDTYKTEARWLKAIQHLREAEKLVDEPKDIGLLMREVPDDIFEEHIDEIKDALFQYFRKDLQRGFTQGLPEWYKALLLDNKTIIHAMSDVPGVTQCARIRDEQGRVPHDEVTCDHCQQLLINDGLLVE